MLEFMAVFAASYVWHAMGITFGYHRLLSHRSFVCAKPLEYFFVLAGYLAFEGSPVWWATMHRAHHRYNDTPLDPHSPRHGMARAQFGWLLEKGYASHIDPITQAPDILADPLYKFLEQDGDWSRAHALGFAASFMFRIVLWICFGWQVALASLLAAVAVMQVPLMLNVVCHLPRFGYKNFATGDEDSVNVWWVGLLALGEGWHNNHHAFPGSAQSGLRWFEFDLTWHVIKLAKRLGWVSRVNVPDAVTKQKERRKDARLRLHRFRALRQQRLALAEVAA
jgi:stearoyl-CoA desaturase (delta-9 desaturase)